MPTIIKSYITLFICLVFLFSFSNSVAAQNVTVNKVPPCDTLGLGGCQGNFKCIATTTNVGSNVTTTISLSTEPLCNNSIGGVSPPTGVRLFNNATQSNGGDAARQNIGIIAFLSNLIKLFAIIAGIWAMFNLIMGGYTLITSMSDAGAMEKVKNNITMTVVGLAIIAGAYIIAAVIGAVMFGDPNFILRPQLQGALQGTTAP